MSRPNSRAISFSRSQTSIGTSIASRQSSIPNYHQIAIELVNGAPLDIVSQRDIRNILLELSVIRSEANDIKDYVKSDNIKEIIIALNKRIKPPPIRYTSNTSPRNSPKEKIENDFIFNDTQENENLNSPSLAKTSLSEDEISYISNEIDQMLRAMQRNALNRTLSTINEPDFAKYHFVINKRREKCLNESRYKELKLLDTLSDKIPKSPKNEQNIEKIDHYNEKIEELRTQIEMSYVQIATLENESRIKVQELITKRDQELEKLSKKHENEITDFNEKNNTISQTVINRQSVALKEMRLNERLAAMSRDYEGAEKIHKNANIKEAEEKDENSRRFEEDITKKREKLDKKQETEIECMKQWFDYLITKEETTIKKRIDANAAAIKSAEIQISMIEGKIKRLSKSPK